MLRNPRWSHARHHTNTYIVGRDSEIGFDSAAAVHPHAVARTVSTFVGGLDMVNKGRRTVVNAFHLLTGLLRQGGPADKVLDHRLSWRTVYIKAVSRFTHWKMNHRCEHHKFPMVPYYNLPRLQPLIRHDLPAPCPSMWHAWREIRPVLRWQVGDQEHPPRRELPHTARPRREDFDAAALGQGTVAAE